MGIIASDSAQTGSRGSGNPGAWNPGSDGGSWQAPAGGSTYTYSWVSGTPSELGATGQSTQSIVFYTTSTTQGPGIQMWVRALVTAAGDNSGVIFAANSTGGNAYIVRYNTTTGNVDIIKNVAGTFTTEVSSAVTVTTGHYYYIKAQWDSGGKIWAKCWDDTAGGGEPGTWTTSWAGDNAYTSGSFGLFIKSGATAHALRFDNFLIQTTPTSGTALGATLGLMGVG